MWHPGPANIIPIQYIEPAAHRGHSRTLGVELSRLSRRTLLVTGVQGLVGASLGAGLAGRPLLAQAPAGGTGSTDLGNGFRVLSLGSTNVLAVSDATGVAL